MIERIDIEQICDVIKQDIQLDQQHLNEMYGANSEAHVEKKGYTRSIVLVEEAKKRLLEIFDDGKWIETR